MPSQEVFTQASVQGANLRLWRELLLLSGLQVLSMPLVSGRSNLLTTQSLISAAFLAAKQESSREDWSRTYQRFDVVRFGSTCGSLLLVAVQSRMDKPARDHRQYGCSRLDKIRLLDSFDNLVCNVDRPIRICVFHARIGSIQGTF